MKKKKLLPEVEQELDFTDVFFKEVSEDVHNDNLKAFWKKYGVQIVAITALCLAITVSFETIKHWRDKQNQQWSNAFTYAQLLQNQGNFDESLKALSNIEKKGNALYSDLAKLEQVNILLQQDKKDEALTLLSDFIKNGHNQKLKNAALIKFALFKADILTGEEMNDLLQPIFQDNGAWMPEAKELVALAYLNHKKYDKALVLYQEISELINLNDTLRARAHNMISVLTSAGENK